MPSEKLPAAMIWLSRWRKLLNTGLILLGVAYLTEIPLRLDLGFIPWQEQYVCIVFGLALGSVFASPRDWHGRNPFRLLADVTLSLLGLLAGVYAALSWPMFAAGVFAPRDLYAAAVTIALLLEATRRTVGGVLFGLGCVSVVFGLTAASFPAPLTGRNVDLESLLLYLYADTSGIVGLPLSIAATVVLAFVLFGSVMFFAGGGQVFIDLALASVGRFRGGPAKAAIVSSSLFGSISGSAVANVVATGSLTIPLMRQSGYRPHTAGGIEAVASTGGQLMPPVMGATAFLMADFLGRPYAEVAIAAIVPAVLLYLSLFVQVHLEAVKQGIRPLTRADIPDLAPILMRSWLLIVPLGVLIALLFVYNWSPARAALTASAVGLLCGFIDRRGRIRPAELVELAARAGGNMLDLLVVTAVAGLVIGALGITGVGFSFALQVVELAGGNLVYLLVLTAFTGLVLGMGMPTTGVYILLAVLAAPALVQLGVPPMAAHMFVLYFGMISMITPPVCIAAFAAASIAGARNMLTGFTAMRLGGASYAIPFVFVASPVLLLESAAPGEFAIAFLSAAIGVSALAAALVGHAFAPLSTLARGLLIAGSLALLWVAGGGDDWLVRLSGKAAAAALVMVVLWNNRRAAGAGRSVRPGGHEPFEEGKADG